MTKNLIRGNTVKTKIYGFFNSTEEYGDALGIAITEDGIVVNTHVSSNESFSIMDLGMAEHSTRGHEIYNEKFPEGWECEFVKISNDRDNHSGLQKALKLFDSMSN